MAHPATGAEATRRGRHPGAPPPEGAPAEFMRGDTASVPPRGHPAGRELIGARDIGELARRVAEAEELHSPRAQADRQRSRPSGP